MFPINFDLELNKINYNYIGDKLCKVASLLLKFEFNQTIEKMLIYIVNDNFNY
jgi:hypothetical protein